MTSATAIATTTDTSTFAQWVCQTCGWVYDEALGDPAHGIAPGTRLADLPDDWYCPECGVTKADFVPLEF